MRIFWDLFENGTIVKHTDNNSTMRGGVMRGLPVLLAFINLFVKCRPCILLFREYPKIQIQVPYSLLSVLTTFIANTNYRTFHIHHLYRPIFFQLFEFWVKVLTKKSTKSLMIIWNTFLKLMLSFLYKFNNIS